VSNVSPDNIMEEVNTVIVSSVFAVEDKRDCSVAPQRWGEETF
jgi:hypothetical protein